jgi:hypothetical protein
MMTYEMVMELLATAGADLEVFALDGEISVTVQDFAGFDDSWREVDRELDDEDLVDSVQEQLEAMALSADGDFYRYYEFDDFTVVWGYASFDI